MITNTKSIVAVFGITVLMGSIFFLEGCGPKKVDINKDFLLQDSVDAQDQTQERNNAQMQNNDARARNGVRDMNGEGEKMQNREMPTELIDACTDKVEGEACEVINESAEVTQPMIGTCTMNSRDDILMCISQDMQRGLRGEVPPSN